MAVIKKDPKETLRDLLKWAIEQLGDSILDDYHFSVGEGKIGEQRIIFDFELTRSATLIEQCKPSISVAAHEQLASSLDII